MIAKKVAGKLRKKVSCREGMNYLLESSDSVDGQVHLHHRNHEIRERDPLQDTCAGVLFRGVSESLILGGDFLAALLRGIFARIEMVWPSEASGSGGFQKDNGRGKMAA